MTTSNTTAIRTPVVAGRHPRAARRWSAPPAVVVSVILLAVVLLAVVAPSLLTSTEPLKADPVNALTAPSLTHPFGTDASGRDIYARVVYGARLSLSIAVAANALGLLTAVLLGLVGGIGGRILDTVMGRALEVMLAFPGLLLLIVIIGMMGTSTGTLIVALAVGGVPGYARLVRGQIISVRNQPYVEAATVLGHPFRRVVVRTILPNALRPFVAVATVGVAQMIMGATALGFLGLGAQPPSPEWGAMLAAGRDFLSLAWWVEFFPGAAIVGVTLAVTAIGRHLQRYFEGRTTS